MMHGREKSDPAIVAKKPANNAGESAAEAMERRAGAEENASQQRTRRTQSRESVSQTPERVRTAARFYRHYPRWEPDAGKPHVRFWAGGTRFPTAIAERKLMFEVRCFRFWPFCDSCRNAPEAPGRGGLETFALSGDQAPGRLATTVKLGRPSAGLVLCTTLNAATGRRSPFSSRLPRSSSLATASTASAMRLLTRI